MNYVTLGKTGLKAAVVSFGGIPIQRADGANTKAVVDKLEEYGINYIDTARGYTVSEEYLGAALEGHRDKFILATKSMSRDAASMAADVETSLRNLRTGYIDLYQLHNLPEKDIEKVFGPGGAYKALTAEELSRCDAVRKELGTQFCRRCGYCAPCPNGIDIPSNFLMANYARKYGLAGWAEQRYKAMPYHAGSCVMCGACEKRCPYGLPIRDMLEGVAKVFGY